MAATSPGLRGPKESTRLLLRCVERGFAVRVTNRTSTDGTPGPIQRERTNGCCAVGNSAGSESMFAIPEAVDQES